MATTNISETEPLKGKQKAADFEQPSDMDLWARFVAVAADVGKYPTMELRKPKIVEALMLATELQQRGVFLRGGPTYAQMYEEYNRLYDKVAGYADGNVELLKEAARHFFAIQHVKAGFDEKDFRIDFITKNNGVQTGTICWVRNRDTVTKYYVKTHQHGPTRSGGISQEPADAKELFIYRLLNLMGIGPEVHFVQTLHTSKKVVYIATKDVGTEEAGLVLLSDIMDTAVDSVKTTALLQLDLVSRLLCLRDCATNSSNCGLVGAKPVIVDFRILTQPFGYTKPKIVDGYMQGNGEFSYLGCMGVATSTSKQVKRDVALLSLAEWNLTVNIPKALAEVEAFVTENKFITSTDLRRYAEDVRQNAEILSCELSA
eukprot:Colp12_sorted_trinity150504_noHs@30848